MNTPLVQILHNDALGRRLRVFTVIGSAILCAILCLWSPAAFAQDADNCAPPMGYILFDRSQSMARHIRSATSSAARVARAYSDRLHLGLWSFPNQVNDCTINYTPDVLAERGNQRHLQNEFTRSRDRVGGGTPLANIIAAAGFNLFLGRGQPQVHHSRD